MLLPMSLLDIIGIRYPIIQAPMAGVSTPLLAATVSNAGGLGSLGIGASSVDVARKMIEDLCSQTNQPFNINVFLHRPARSRPEVEAAWLKAMQPLFNKFSATPPGSLKEIYKSFLQDEEMVAMLVDVAPKVISFHFGLPDLETIKKLKSAGCVLISTATNLSEATKAVEMGVDAIVAQGYEAGGHRGMFGPSLPDEYLATQSLTSLLIKELKIPIIAAGGIMDGKEIKKMLDMGASAVQVGTAFILCPETSADEGYRNALAAAQKDGTVMTSAISGRPARCLKNNFTLWGSDKLESEIPDYPIAYDAGKALHAAAKEAGENGYGAQWAGSGAWRSRSMPAADLMQKLILEMGA
jgi:nitronate monooxygenase